ncbi:MAG: hypothetical protein ACRCTZ_14670 [Sarcina sp.]
MKYSEREKITKAQARKKAIAFLETNNFFGLDRESVENGKELNEIICRATDEFTLIREISAAILKFETEAEHKAAAKAKKEQAAETPKEHEPVNIKMVSIAFVNDKDLTVGELLAEMTERYTKAGLLDVKLSDFKTEDGSMASVMKLNETGMKTYAIGYDEHTCCEYNDMVREAYMEQISAPLMPVPGMSMGTAAFKQVTPEDIIKAVLSGISVPGVVVRR